VTVNVPARVARICDCPTSANRFGRNLASTVMITSGTASRLRSSAASNAPSGMVHSATFVGIASPSIDRRMNAASVASARNRHEFQVVLSRSDLRIHNIVGAEPKTYAVASNTGLRYSNPNIIGIPLRESECDSFRISTCKAVASARPKATTIAKNGIVQARSGTVRQHPEPGPDRRRGLPGSTGRRVVADRADCHHDRQPPDQLFPDQRASEVVTVR
jgi:hypothetical protein